MRTLLGPVNSVLISEVSSSQGVWLIIVYYTVTNQGVICIVSNVGMPKVVSAFRIIKGLHLRGES